MHLRTSCNCYLKGGTRKSFNFLQTPSPQSSNNTETMSSMDTEEVSISEMTKQLNSELRERKRQLEILDNTTLLDNIPLSKYCNRNVTYRLETPEAGNFLTDEELKRIGVNSLEKRLRKMKNILDALKSNDLPEEYIKHYHYLTNELQKLTSTFSYIKYSCGKQKLEIGLEKDDIVESIDLPLEQNVTSLDTMTEELFPCMCRRKCKFKTEKGLTEIPRAFRSYTSTPLNTEPSCCHTIDFDLKCKRLERKSQNRVPLTYKLKTPTNRPVSTNGLQKAVPIKQNVTKATMAEKLLPCRCKGEDNKVKNLSEIFAVLPSSTNDPINHKPTWYYQFDMDLNSKCSERESQKRESLTYKLKSPVKCRQKAVPDVHQSGILTNYHSYSNYKKREKEFQERLSLTNVLENGKYKPKSRADKQNALAYKNITGSISIDSSESAYKQRRRNHSRTKQPINTKDEISTQHYNLTPSKETFDKSGQPFKYTEYEKYKRTSTKGPTMPCNGCKHCAYMKVPIVRSNLCKAVANIVENINPYK